MSESEVKLLNSPYGEVSYESFRKLKRAFADKSAIIKSLDDNGMTLYPVLLRPRRFGKSTFIQMLKCFYDISYADRYEELFYETNIYNEHLESHNTYHVLNFDFSRVGTQSNTVMYNSFFSAVALVLIILREDILISYLTMIIWTNQILLLCLIISFLPMPAIPIKVDFM